MADGPLSGFRILEYGQYVAVPFATMLLADLGADVIKIEPPTGDQYRHYDPFAPGESRFFYSLNRNKRAVVLDLKTAEGMQQSAALVATADAVIHNLLPERASRYGLDRASVRSVNPRAIWVNVSPFGSAGPDAGRPGFDFTAQARSGLLLADPRPDDSAPHRLGGLAIVDFTTGMLAAISALTGLLARATSDGIHNFEVSLLGSALALQAQRFVSVAGLDEMASAGRVADHTVSPEGFAQLAAAIHDREALEPYYRSYRCLDGFLTLACLNLRQRQGVCDLIGLADPWIDNPQQTPVDEAERRERLAHVTRLEDAFQRRPVAGWLAELDHRNVPAVEVRALHSMFDDPQVRANGLVQVVTQPGAGAVRLLGNLFKVDERNTPAARPAPALDEHHGELFDDLGRVVGGQRHPVRVGNTPGGLS